MTAPTRRKDPDPGAGAGMYLPDEAAGVDVDITEDEDGPVRGSPDSYVRVR